MFDEADAIFTLGLGVQQTKVKGILPLAAVAPAPITEWLQLVVASVCHSLSHRRAAEYTRTHFAKRLRANKRENYLSKNQHAAQFSISHTHKLDARPLKMMIISKSWKSGRLENLHIGCFDEVLFV
jgi:hypothetical protein